MKVKVIRNYIDKQLNKELTVGEIIEVESEARLRELLGANQQNIVCVEVIGEKSKEPQKKDTAQTPETAPEANPEAETNPNETTLEEGENTGNPDENPQENNSEETDTKKKNQPRTANTKGDKKNAKK